MSHLTETQLNEYLDGELDAPTRAAVDSHLTTCNSCRLALSELQTIATLLNDLPDEPLTRDLTPAVLTNLPLARLALGWKLVLAAQAGVALGLSLLVIVNVLPRISLPALPELPAIVLPILKLPTIHFPSLFSSIILHPSSFSIAFLALSAFLLWGVGNVVLLRKRIEVQK